MGCDRNRRFGPGKFLGTYGTGHNVPVFEEMYESAAFRVLGDQEKLVLLDWLRVYGRASGWDHYVVEGGVVFTWGQCRCRVSNRWFYRHRARLCSVGFLEKAPEYKELRVAAPDRFVPSTRWRQYVPTPDESSKLQAFEAKKTRKLANDKNRRTRFRTNLRRKNATYPKSLTSNIPKVTDIAGRDPPPT